MSAEGVKKRGRPKKLISDPVEIEMPEKKKSTTRAKSTKAAVKPAKPTASEPVAATVSKTARITSTNTKAASKPPAPSPPASAKTEPKPALSKPATKTPVTPETSKILEQVRDLAAKKVPASPDPTKVSKPSPTTTTPGPASASPETPSASTNTPPPYSEPIPPPKPTKIPPAASKAPQKIPFAAMNSEIVSNISTRAGARPNAGPSGKLPPNYKSTARKYTAAIVAMPILIVTSYVLYERREFLLLVQAVVQG
jgi:hypothetical protein